MHPNFGGRGLSSFGDIATFKNGQFSLSDLDGSHSNLLQTQGSQPKFYDTFTTEDVKIL